ncbi:hypothetical protein, partial [Mobilicoccus pelagius]|uniref:hypothetical protein n=1 Tax=Mobilicoccus pelagius TaxID=746032 RepID=UPI001C3F35E0
MQRLQIKVLLRLRTLASLKLAKLCSRRSCKTSGFANFSYAFAANQRFASEATLWACLQIFDLLANFSFAKVSEAVQRNVVPVRLANRRFAGRAGLT